MPPQFVLTMQNVAKFYDEKPVFQEISLSFYYGAKIGIVGENGAGKSSLLKIMAGVDPEFMGESVLTKGMRIGYVPQEPMLDPAKNVRENLETALAPIHRLMQRYDEVIARMGENPPNNEMDALMEEMGTLQERIDAVDGWEADRLLDVASDALCLPPDDADVGILSGGERRRVALCKALLEKPDLLLLDEPTNHLDAETVAWLEQALREYHGTVIVVTHDRYFLDNVTEWILELDNGRGIPFQGNYSSWLEQKSEMLRRSEKQESQRQKILTRELEWINSSPEGRRKKSQARVSRYEELSGKKFEASKDDVLIQIPPGPRLGDKVIEFDSVSKGYAGQALIAECTFRLPRGAVVGVIGPNGCGKTTLFRMIAKQEQPDQGKIVFGDAVLVSHVDQHRDALNDANSVFQEITGGAPDVELGGGKMNARAYLARFNFRGAAQQKMVGQLSGGERNRVHLAKLLKSGGNLLLLDEPTNDLDVGTMRVLEEAICDFAGCAMVISHDRFFLDRICTHLLVFEGNGKTRWFEGNFRDYEERILAKDGNHFQRRRGKYKRLSLRA
jgi:ATP-binding cassette ChvD family protein